MLVSSSWLGYCEFVITATGVNEVSWAGTVFRTLVLALVRGVVHVSSRDNLILRNNNVHNIFAYNILSDFVSHNVHFPCAVNIDTKTYGKLSCVSNRHKHTGCDGVSLLRGCGCVKLGCLLGGQGVVSFSLLFRRFPRRVLPCSCRTCFRYPRHCIVMAAGYRANRTGCFRRGQDGRHIVSVIHTSDDLPFIYPVACISGVPVLSKNVISDVPLVHTHRSKFAGGIIILAHGRKCHGRVRKAGIPPFVCGGCPLLHRTVGHHDVICGRRLRRIRQVRTTKRVIIVHPRGPMIMSHVRHSVGGLARLCRRKCQYTRRFTFHF